VIAPQAAGGLLNSLFIRHATPNAREVALTLTGVALTGIHAAMGLGPQGRHMAVLVRLDLQRSLKGQDLALDAGLFIGMGADGDVQEVVLLPQLVEGDILAHLDPGMYLNAQGQDGVDLRIQLLPGEAVAGDAVAHHATQLGLLLIDRDLVAHKGQEIGGGEAAGAAAMMATDLPVAGAFLGWGTLPAWSTA